MLRRASDRNAVVPLRSGWLFKAKCYIPSPENLPVLAGGWWYEASIRFSYHFPFCLCNIGDMVLVSPNPNGTYSTFAAAAASATSLIWIPKRLNWSSSSLHCFYSAMQLDTFQCCEANWTSRRAKPLPVSGASLLYFRVALCRIADLYAEWI